MSARPHKRSMDSRLLCWCLPFASIFCPSGKLSELGYWSSFGGCNSGVASRRFVISEVYFSEVCYFRGLSFRRFVIPEVASHRLHLIGLHQRFVISAFQRERLSQSDSQSDSGSKPETPNFTEIISQPISTGTLHSHRLFWNWIQKCFGTETWYLSAVRNPIAYQRLPCQFDSINGICLSVFTFQVWVAVVCRQLPTGFSKRGIHFCWHPFCYLSYR